MPHMRRYGLVPERDFPYTASASATCPSALLLPGGPSAAYLDVVVAAEPSGLVAYEGRSAKALMEVGALV